MHICEPQSHGCGDTSSGSRGKTNDEDGAGLNCIVSWNGYDRINKDKLIFGNKSVLCYVANVH